LAPNASQRYDTHHKDCDCDPMRFAFAPTLLSPLTRRVGTPVTFDLGSIDSGATAWVLASSASVMLMAPGLAFFYGGMVRARHVMSIIMQNFTVLALVSVVWMAVAFSLAFGRGNGFIGDLHFAGLAHMNEAIPGYTGARAQRIPPIVFAAFQMMFAVLTPALITGSTADRWKFGAFVPFVALWAVLVYSPVAHWVFSPVGWASKLGALDFAGGTVVHANAGAAGLAMALVLGRRRGWPSQEMRPHNLPLVMVGAALLWFGWFGFNAGSTLGAGNLAGFAFVNTNTAAAAGVLAWSLVEKFRYGKATTLGAASGAVAGLVAVTPCAGYVSPLGALAVGAIAGALCALAVSAKSLFRIDDSLDVVGVHLVGGIVGSLGVGLFATRGINPDGADGLFYNGGYTLLGKQAMVLAAVIAYSFAVTTFLGRVLDRLVGNRVPARAELTGLDVSVHGELGYEGLTALPDPVGPDSRPPGRHPAGPVREPVSAGSHPTDPTVPSSASSAASTER
jgi:Amt family ammonium transporter